MTATREQEITASLKRCSPETVAAALSFQTTHSEADLSKIINGVLERDLPDTHTAELAAATDETRLVDDLGMDSFGMIEVVMTAEEVFGITIPNQELRDIHTLGALKSYLLGKVHSTHAEAALAS
jgi:acyl carrier protein